jgi:urease accessory protein
LNGSLFLRAGVCNGRTVLLESAGTYPLQVTRPHATEAPDGLSLVVLLLSGGLLDGDRLSIDVRVERGARLALRTQAATQLHHGCSSQVLRADVREAAWFSYLPHTLVPHANADHHARVEVSMQPAARVLVADALSPGRAAFGEAFAYTRVRLDLDVAYDGILVARERALIRPDAGIRASQFGRYSHVAGAYLLGPGEPPTLESCSELRIGSSELAHSGWYVRALATRAADLDDALARLHQRWWQGA